MPSKPTIESWLPEAIEAFNKVYPVPDVSYVIVTKSKEDAIIAEWAAKLDIPSSLGRSNNWAGLTIPGYKGIAIIIRQYGLHGKTDFKHYLWHELGHAFAFTHESREPLWASPSPAYMVWAEFIADMIGFTVALSSHNPIPLSPKQRLNEIFYNNKINVGAIGHFCSETQFTAFPENTPAPIRQLSEMFAEKIKASEYWKIDQGFLNQIMRRLYLLLADS